MLLRTAAISAGPPRRGAASRYVISLILLVAIIGGVAWVVQYLPEFKPRRDPNTNPSKSLLAFLPPTAVWPKVDTAPKKEAEKKEFEGYKEIEQGDAGHYDFLFKNVSEGDVEIVNYKSACDCANVKATVLPADEQDRLAKIFVDKPGEPLPYAKEPNWQELTTEAKSTGLIVKANEAGVVRVGWIARKSPGQPLNVRPQVFYQPVGNPGGRQSHLFEVPIIVRHAVQFDPVRLSIGVLTAGAVLSKDINAWSSTRDKLDLKLTTIGHDPYFTVETRPLSDQERADLEDTIKRNNPNNPPTRVRSGARITVTVRENVDGKQQLELGSFYRKLMVNLKQGDEYKPFPEMPGPEVVGRVEGEITIGGADDRGRIRFDAFAKSDGGSKTVELTAPEDAKIELAACSPPWVKIKLTLDEKNRPPKQRVWRLEATVPPETPTVRPFDEPDAVVLRVFGPKTNRLVRIPIDGHVEGR